MCEQPTRVVHDFLERARLSLVVVQVAEEIGSVECFHQVGLRAVPHQLFVFCLVEQFAHFADEHLQRLFSLVFSHGLDVTVSAVLLVFFGVIHCFDY